MNDFWKPKPTDPRFAIMTYALLVPILVSAFGFFVVGVFAFAFDSINIIPENVRQWMTVFGSAFVVFGAELNSPGTFIEYFRKRIKGEDINGWDDFALVASAIGTIANVLIVFAIAIVASKTFSGEALWLNLVLNWMPLIAAIGVVGDYVGSLIELGHFLGSYEKRYERWLEEKHDYEQGETEPGMVERLLHKVEHLELELAKHDWPILKKAEFVEWRKGVNGCKLEGLELVEWAAGQLARNVPHERTIARWQKEGIL